MAEPQMVKLPISIKFKKPSPWTTKLIVGGIAVAAGDSMLFFSQPYNYVGGVVFIVGVVVIFSLYNTFHFKIPQIKKQQDLNNNQQL